MKFLKSGPQEKTRKSRNNKLYSFQNIIYTILLMTASISGSAQSNRETPTPISKISVSTETSPDSLFQQLIEKLQEEDSKALIKQARGLDDSYDESLDCLIDIITKGGNNLVIAIYDNNTEERIIYTIDGTPVLSYNTLGNYTIYAYIPDINQLLPILKKISCSS